MNNNDNLQKFLFEDIPVRGELIRLESTYQIIVNQHPYSPLIKKILAEALLAASLLTAVIKFKGRLTVQFKGANKLKLLLIQCTHEFHLRGLAQLAGEFSSFDELLNDLRQGTLAITIEPAVSNGQRYQGIVAWKGNSIFEAIEGYFKNSEQIPTHLWCAINDKKAVGLMLQVMPKEKPELFINDWDNLIHLTNTIKSSELLNWDNQTLLQRLYAEENVRLFSPMHVKFQCNCSVARGENAILLLGKEETEEELKLHKKIVVTCEFCNKEFIFDKVDVAAIFNKVANTPPSIH